MASPINTEIVTGSHLFKITGYSNTKGIGIGNYIVSNQFTVGGYTWLIRYYPDGDSWFNFSTHVSLFLKLQSFANDVKASFDVKLCNSNGSTTPSKSFGPLIFGMVNSTYGASHFIQRDELEASQYLEDDTIMVRCTVSVYNSIVQPPNESFPSIKNHFGKLLESGEGTDVAFVVDEKIFHAHKSILAARSPVFRNQLYNLENENREGPIRIENMDSRSFKSLLHFIYTDSLPETEEVIVGSLYSTLVFQNLFVAAERYEMAKLKSICEDNLCACISTINTSTNLALAEQHGLRRLKDACKTLMRMNEIHTTLRNLRYDILNSNSSVSNELGEKSNTEVMEPPSSVCEESAPGRRTRNASKRPLKNAMSSKREVSPRRTRSASKRPFKKD